MKTLLYILRKASIIFILVFSITSVGIYSVSAATGEYIDGKDDEGNQITRDYYDLNTDTYNNLDKTNPDNQKLEKLAKENDRFIKTDAKGGARDIATTLARIAKDLKNIFYGIAFVYFLIITFQLLFSGNSDEAIGKFKKGITWITIGLIIMQIAFALVVTLFNKEIDVSLAGTFIENIVVPLVLFLQTIASFFFLAIGIYAFYRLITANGNEDATKSAKMSVFYAIIGFIVIKISSLLVSAFYSETCSKNVTGTTAAKFSDSLEICSDKAEGLSGVSKIIFGIINWANSFVAIAIVIMIIYVGVQVMTSNGDEEVMKKAKRAILYIFIGVLILTVNYLILSFGLLQGVDIPNPNTVVSSTRTLAHI